MDKEKELIFEEKLNRLKDENGNIAMNDFLMLVKEELKEESDKLDEELARELEGVDVVNEINKMWD